jgi:hypothetical protein
MSGYIPGQGRKRPLNNLESPQYPDIRKGPPRFIWTKKFWQVDTGRTMAEVEHTPLQDYAILYQSYDYGKQHLYGRHPTYNVFVNKEFRPPLIERDDILPLSRLPRPVVTDARINPGTAFASGNSAFEGQQNMIQGIEKYISNRVKEGQIRPTFFNPIEMPADNSILPDLETKLPMTSASASFKFPGIGQVQPRDMELPYKQFHPSVIADVTPINIDTRSAMRDLDLRYNQPQVSASAASSAVAHMQPGLVESFSPIELDYTNPQVSASSVPMYKNTSKLTPVDLDLQYQSPQVSASAGYHTHTNQELTPINFDLDTKIEGSQPAVAYAKGVRKFDDASSRISMDGDVAKLGRKLDAQPYVVPITSQPATQAMDDRNMPEFRRKVASLERYIPATAQGHVPRAGITDPNQKIKIRKNH